MRRLAARTVIGAALAAAVGVGGAAYDRPVRRAPETRVVPPLADPALAPGVAGCTSDGACTVTDASGTRAATALGPPR
jgi:hypothetical protein